MEVTVGESIEMMSINQFCEEQESSSFLDIVRTNVRKYTTLLRDFLELSVPSDLNSGISLYNILDYELVNEIYKQLPGINETVYANDYPRFLH